MIFYKQEIIYTYSYFLQLTTPSDDKISMLVLDKLTKGAIEEDYAYMKNVLKTDSLYSLIEVQRRFNDWFEQRHFGAIRGIYHQYPYASGRSSIAIWCAF